jgi:hypothetical protein
MNERIKELAISAGMTKMNQRSDGLYVVGEEVFDTFAKILIEKCVGACSLNAVGMVGTHASAYNSAIGACVKNIKQTFEIEP